jgi:hypothetical protein
MSTDWKALCAALLEDVRYLIDAVCDGEHDPVALQECAEDRDRARAALAQPEYAPASQALADLVWPDPTTITPCGMAINGRMYRLTPMDEPEPVGPTDEELFCLEDLRDAWSAQAAVNSWDELGMDEIIWFAQQQALARWGRPTITPIPISERLPAPEDCDADGRCWFSSCLNADGRWNLEDRTSGMNGWYSHWLPAHALPLPGQPAPTAPAP